MQHPDKRPEVSIEFMPTAMESSAEDTDRPTDGRFIGLGIVDKGADRGNMIHLLASAKKEEEQMKREESRTSGAPLPGSFEWIGEQVLTKVTASATLPMNVIATYPDRMVW